MKNTMRQLTSEKIEINAMAVVGEYLMNKPTNCLTVVLRECRAWAAETSSGSDSGVHDGQL